MLTALLLAAPEGPASPLAAWESFYVIVGSSAAALTGLQFVVMTLIAGERRTSDSPAQVSAFGTPTIVHFCAVLLVSAILSAPWHSRSGPAFSLAACGLAGIGYCAIVVRRARRQKGYAPVLEDWVWHAVLPLVAYATLFVGAIGIPRRPASSLFEVATGAVLLLFVGIHNSWDTVTYIAVERRQKEARETR
jgi:hypothetical protein